MRLFDEVATFGQRTILENELEFDYYQGSGRPEMIRVKNLLESWFAEYPDGKEKETLRQKLRGEKSNGKKTKISMREESFHHAFFELYIYILLRRLGCELTIHPSIEHLEGRKEKPDFLATHKDTGYSFYVEATVQRNERVQKQDLFQRDLTAALDQMDSPDFVICMDRFRITAKSWTPSTERFTRFVHSRLSDLHSNPCSRNLNPPTFQGQGWQVSLHFQSRSEQDGWVEPSRSFKETASTRPLHSKENIRKAIKDKASRYGNLDHPFIIAINVMEHFVDPQTVAEALYGSISHIYNVIENDASVIGDLEFSHFEPKPNGAFRARGRQNTRVSAIWIARSPLCPSNIGSVKLYEFQNHFAQRKFVPPFPCLTRCYIDEHGELSAVQGLTTQQIFGVKNYWPEDEPFPK